MEAQKRIICDHATWKGKENLTSKGIAKKLITHTYYEGKGISIVAKVIQKGTLREQTACFFITKRVRTDKCLHAREERVQWYTLKDICWALDCQSLPRSSRWGSAVTSKAIV